jgi:hypothetical protein
VEVIRKPKRIATEIISLRVIAGLKKDLAKAREIAERLEIDMTAMMSNALSDVFNAIAHINTKGAASSSAPAADDHKRVNTDVNTDVNKSVNNYSNGGTK